MGESKCFRAFGGVIGGEELENRLCLASCNVGGKFHA